MCAYAQDPETTVDPDEVVSIPREEAETKAVAALKRVMEFGPQIELDHYMVYAAREYRVSALAFLSGFQCLMVVILRSDYELGRLLACMGKADEARKHFEMVLSGKPLEVNPAGRKVKFFPFSELMCSC